MTVFFSDMAGFTTISELLTPQALVRLINAYLIEMSKPIAKENGVIDKFIGDAIMAYWGAPFVSESDHPRLAVRAGLQMFEYLDKFRLDVPEVTGLRTGAPNVDIRIGIATGPVLIGNMGSATMKSYTIMGDTVNLAARLEQACKTYSLRILISEATYLPTANDFLAREIDLIAVKGKSEAIRIFEPIAEMDLSTADHQRVVAQFAGALADYRLQKWDAAEAGFKAVLNARPGDGPSKVFLERISLLRDTPPAENWDGVWHMTEK
jgi:adenylate cyclase